MKYKDWSIVAILLTIFVLTMSLGLYVANNYFTKEIPYGLEPPEVDKDISPWYLFFAVLVMTGIFLLIHKLGFNSLIKAWFFIAFVVTASVALSTFIEPIIAFVIVLVIFLIKYREKDAIFHNMGEILVYVGLSAILVNILNLVAVVILLLLISIYDFVSVFITKHMIVLAKAQQKLGLFSGLIVKKGKEVAILGGGDIVFPLMFASVLLRDYNIYYSILTIVFTALSLLFLMYLGERKKFYPAMPFITAGCLAVIPFVLLNVF
jgi:presenilin-like A22 family membrane protease